MRTLPLAVLLCAAACGADYRSNLDSDGGSGGGGDAFDAMIDADPTVRGPVTVRVLDKNGAPIAGMPIVFIDTDATVSELATDTSGTVTASVYPGASVTAVRERAGGGDYAITTVLQLVPNDMLTLISAASDVSSTQDPFSLRVVPLPSADIASATKSGPNATFTTVRPHGLTAGDTVIVAGVSEIAYNGTRTVASTPTPTSFTVNIGGGGPNTATGGTATKALPLDITFPAYAGATSYEVHTPCGPVDVGATTNAELYLREGCATSPMDILVFAKTSASVEAAYAQATDVAFTPGGSVTITDSWHPVTTIAATYTNPTTRVTTIDTERFTPYVRGTAPATANDAAGDPVTLMLDAATPAAAWMRSSLRCPDGSADDCISSPIGTARQSIAQRVDGTATTYALDIGANLLPWVNAVYTPETTTIEVTVTGSGAIDLFEANLRYVRGQTIYTWRVFGPVAGNVTFPTLPSTVPGDPTVRPTDVQSVYQVYVCESDAIAGYRDAVKNVYEALGTCEMAATPTVKPYGGTLNRLSQWN